MGEIQYVGGTLGPIKVNKALYINSHVGQTPKGEGDKIYLVCYLTWEKKETSCKEIG